MPRRQFPVVPLRELVINGQTVDEIIDEPVALKDFQLVRAEISEIIDRFDEFALENRSSFVHDLVVQVGHAQARPERRLTSGKDSKPDAWTLQNLFVGVGRVMERHGLQPTISEYLNASGELRRSPYLRLAAEMAKIARLALPADLKPVALKARKMEDLSRTQRE